MPLPSYEIEIIDLSYVISSWKSAEILLHKDYRQLNFAFIVIE